MKFFRNIFLILFILGFFIAIFNIPSKTDDSNTNVSDTGYSDENCLETQVLNHKNKISSRSWVNYKSSDFCLEYVTNIEKVEVSKEYRNRYQDIVSKTELQFWGALYNKLYQNNREEIKSIADSLIALKNNRNLNRNEFANMVVSFVQDIPYVYILDKERCEDQDMNQGNCVTNTRFGILSPIECLHSLNGDCDTRTVLLYSLFKTFHYSPRIAVSFEYAHSVLLLDVQASGDYITEHGVKYFFWETTATGWEAGILPPNCNDINKWNIVLK